MPAGASERVEHCLPFMRAEGYVGFLCHKYIRKSVEAFM